MAWTIKVEATGQTTQHKIRCSTLPQSLGEFRFKAGDKIIIHNLNWFKAELQARDADFAFPTWSIAWKRANRHDKAERVEFTVPESGKVDLYIYI